MTQEYEFFKDFAGVTKADLEMFKCGGKKRKMEAGGTAEMKNKKKNTTNTPPVRRNLGIMSDTQVGVEFRYPGTKQPNDTILKETRPDGKVSHTRLRNGKEVPSNAKEYKEGRKGKKK